MNAETPRRRERTQEMGRCSARSFLRVSASVRATGAFLGLVASSCSVTLSDPCGWVAFTTGERTSRRVRLGGRGFGAVELSNDACAKADPTAIFSERRIAGNLLFLCLRLRVPTPRHPQTRRHQHRRKIRHVGILVQPPRHRMCQGAGL